MSANTPMDTTEKLIFLTGEIAQMLRDLRKALEADLKKEEK